MADAPGDAELSRTLGKTKPFWDALVTEFSDKQEWKRFSEKAAWSFHCGSVALSLIPTNAGDRVKTDRRDAEKLPRCLRAGGIDGGLGTGRKTRRHCGFWCVEEKRAKKNQLRAVIAALFDTIRHASRLDGTYRNGARRQGYATPLRAVPVTG